MTGPEIEAVAGLAILGGAAGLMLWRALGGPLPAALIELLTGGPDAE